MLDGACIDVGFGNGADYPVFGTYIELERSTAGRSRLRAGGIAYDVTVEGRALRQRLSLLPEKFADLGCRFLRVPHGTLETT